MGDSEITPASPFPGYFPVGGDRLGTLFAELCQSQKRDNLSKSPSGASSTITGMRITKRRATYKLALTVLSVAPIIVAAQSLSDRQSNSPRVRVLVLDALDGKPQAGVNVDYLCGEIPHSTTAYEITDKTGTAEVPFSCRPGNKIELIAVPKNALDQLPILI